LRGDEIGFLPLLDELKKLPEAARPPRSTGVWHGAWTLVETK